jgi:hypothetical protein
MPSSGMLRIVALARTDVSIIRVRRIGELGTMLTVSTNQSMLVAHSCHPDDGGDKFLLNVG